jgi:hypothetical protein
MAALSAIVAFAAHAGGAPQAGQAQVREYRPVFEACARPGRTPQLAIRSMKINGIPTWLTVDPTTLSTQLDREQDWSCTDTNDEQQKDTRYLRAVRASIAPPASAVLPSDVIAYGGLLRGPTPGSFITGDLCPSRRPLDRAFIETLLSVQSPLPVALSISGLWLTHHRAEFEWLRDQERAGALQITWVDHSYHHPYVPGRALADNFLLMPGVDMRAEILDTERLVIADGETPSVFFRFPGLMANHALLQVTGEYHLIVLGAGAWLARSPRARPGDIILVHLNGNEPAGLRIFSTLLAKGKLPQPFKKIGELP